MSEGQKFQLGTVGALSLSVVSSVSIVICNKALISTLGFTFGECLYLRTLSFWYNVFCVVTLDLALLKLMLFVCWISFAVVGIHNRFDIDGVPNGNIGCQNSC
jgi:solute carrier family 35 protein E3